MTPSCLSPTVLSALRITPSIRSFSWGLSTMPLSVIIPFLLVTTNPLGSLIKGSTAIALMACETSCSSLYLVPLAPNNFEKKLIGIPSAHLYKFVCYDGCIHLVGGYGYTFAAAFSIALVLLGCERH